MTRVRIKVWGVMKDTTITIMDDLVDETDAHDVLRDALWAAGVETPERAITEGGPVESMAHVMINWEVTS